VRQVGYFKELETWLLGYGHQNHAWNLPVPNVQ